MYWSKSAYINTTHTKGKHRLPLLVLGTLVLLPTTTLYLASWFLALGSLCLCFRMEPTVSNILSAVLWALLLGVIIRFTSVYGRDKVQRAAFGGLFALKLLMGVGVWAVYTYYYTDKSTSDIHRFFADAEVVYHTLFENLRNARRRSNSAGGPLLIPGSRKPLRPSAPSAVKKIKYRALRDLRDLRAE